MHKYQAGVFQYDNDWVDDSVLDSLVGKTFFTRFLDSMVEAVVKKVDGQVAVEFEVDKVIPSEEFYLDVATSCSYDGNLNKVVSIDYIEEMFLTKNFYNTEILKLRAV